MREPFDVTSIPRQVCSLETSREILHRLLPLWPEDVFDLSREGRARLIAKLARALSAEHARARAKSHAYDPARHIQLARAYREECDALLRLDRMAATAERPSPLRPKRTHEMPGYFSRRVPRPIFLARSERARA